MRGLDECDRGVTGEIKRCEGDKCREREGVRIVMGVGYERVAGVQDRAALCMVSRLTKAVSDGRQPLQRSHGLQ